MLLSGARGLLKLYSVKRCRCDGHRLPYGTILYHTILHHTRAYNAYQFGMVWCGTILYHTLAYLGEKTTLDRRPTVTRTRATALIVDRKPDYNVITDWYRTIRYRTITSYHTLSDLLSLLSLKTLYVLETCNNFAIQRSSKLLEKSLYLPCLKK
jgi:hypothetical protein